MGFVRASACFAAVCAVALLCGCGSSLPTIPRRIGPPLQSIFEDEGLLHSDPPLALATFRALGVDTVRVYVPWDKIAPDPSSAVRPDFDASDPGAYPASGWTVYDEIVRDAAAAGLRLDLTVGSPPPLWAGGSGAPARSIYAAEWRPSALQFGEFVHALGLRYSGHYVPTGETQALPRVDFWSIWNEPNYGPYLAPQAIDHSTIEVAPSLYRGLLDSAWTALAETGHTPARDTILIGETAPRGAERPGNFDGMLPLRFIRALYCVNKSFRPLRGRAASLRACPSTASGSARFVAENPALFRASGWADHPYPDALPPNVRTPPPLGDGWADFASLGTLERTLDRSAAAYRQSPRLPLYSTEFGYMTNPPYAGGVTVATAALYLNQAEYLSWLNPRIRSYDQYLLTDPGPGSGSNFVTGIEFANGKPKPDVYDAYRMPLFLPVTHAAQGVALLVWGCVRPAPETRARTGRTQRAAIQLASRYGAPFRTIRTVVLSNPQGYFAVDVRFPSSGIVRLSWDGTGRELHSRGQPISVS